MAQVDPDAGGEHSWARRICRHGCLSQMPDAEDAGNEAFPLARGLAGA
jgi:hypothetical protein